MSEIELTPWQRELIIRTHPDPTAILDIIERVAELPDATVTMAGTYDVPETDDGARLDD